MRSGTRSQLVTTVEGQRTTGTPSANGQRDVPGALTIPAGSKSAVRTGVRSVKSRFLHDRSDKRLFEDRGEVTFRQRAIEHLNDERRDDVGDLHQHRRRNRIGGRLLVIAYQR